MKFVGKEKYRGWAIALIIVAIILFYDQAFPDNEKSSSEKTVIKVCAPENMQEAFVKTLKDTKKSEDYTIEFTEDIKSANFIVSEGLSESGKLIAYSPIVAVFNNDNELYENLINKKIFVESSVMEEDYDFDFKRIMNLIIEKQSSDFKIYYPSEKSSSWEEFYNFLLFTINDGYYPKDSKDMENAVEKVKVFLNSKYVEPIDIDSLETINGFAKDAIYFTPLVKLAEWYDKSAFSCRIMYPKIVVNHNYYANFDETGKVLYDALDGSQKFLFLEAKHVGYYNLRCNSYHTIYGEAYNVGLNILGRSVKFNAVEIPVN